MAAKKSAPKTDDRPYEAYDPEDPDKFVVRCWFESTVKEYCKLTGLKWRKRQIPSKQGK